jgi:flagellar biosynthetic protein FliQ
MLTPDAAADLIAAALRVVMLLSAILVLPGLIVGVLVALIQSATQINEQTLSFLPRLLVTLLTLIVAGRWMGSYLMDFCVAIFQRAAALVG